MYINILGTDYTDFTDQIVFSYTKNRVNPCNPCLKNKFLSFYQKNGKLV